MSATFEKKKAFFSKLYVFFLELFPSCSLGGTLCMFCGKICTISATLLTQKNNFLKNEDHCVCKVWNQPHFWYNVISATYLTQKRFSQRKFPRTFPLAHSVAHYACFAKKSVQFQRHYWHKKIIFSKIKISVCVKHFFPGSFDTKKRSARN